MSVVFTVLRDILTQWRGYDYGHGPGMMGWGSGLGWFGGIIMAIFWIAVIVGIILLIRWVIISTRTASHGTSIGESALDILKKRYARGEIDKQEFEEKKKDLLL
jgi:putative membrane protein